MRISDGNPNDQHILVDDDEIDVMKVQRAFERNQISNSLFVARDGVEALEMLRGKRSLELAIPSDRRIIITGYQHA